MSKRFIGIIGIVLCLVACGGHERLTRERAVELIEDSKAFQSPIDPGIVFLDAQFHPGPNTHREIVRVTGLAPGKDYAFGLGGKTAIGAFIWRWNEGPFAGRDFVSKAKFYNSGDGWKIYNDLLKQQLYAAERGEEG